jgi:chaperone modulatory protein CbpM
MTNGDWILKGELLDETVCVRIDEFCARLHVAEDWVVELVALGALEPRSGGEPSAWVFALTDLPRVRVMARLVAELDVNLPGAAIILDLLEERRRLASRVRQLTG